MTAEPYYTDESVTVFHGDCLDVMRTLPDNSVDAVVTDPPYGLEFMGKEWDAPWKDNGRWGRDDSTFVDRPKGGNSPFENRERPKFSAGLPFQRWCEQWAAECLRVLKPGGHMLTFGGTRTWHRLACAVEDAGFEIRDSIAWLYGSGFPKSLNVSAAIDKAGGAEPVVLGPDEYRRARANRGTTSEIQPSYDKPRVAQADANLTAPATPAAQQWAGWGTALKPAFEPIMVARKPLAGTVAANVLEHGVGALNIDACRVPGVLDGDPHRFTKTDGSIYGSGKGYVTAQAPVVRSEGRWPTNVVLDGDAADALDRQSAGMRAAKPSGSHAGHNAALGGDVYAGQTDRVTGGYDDLGASRFFPTFRYQAKAPARERPSYVDENGVKHAHSTVKPVALIRWLARLVCQPGGVILDPFAGSGTTAEAATLEGFRCIAVEREADYLPLILARLERNRRKPNGLADDALALFDFEEPA